MGDKSAIQWTSATWNPATGCTRVSPGCENCYAFTFHDRMHAYSVREGGINPTTGAPIPTQYAKPFSEIQLLPERLEQPFRWKRPRRIFVDSMSDLFHSKVPDEYIIQVFEAMNKADWHTYQILTKRPGRLRRLGPLLPWGPHIGIGVSIESRLYVRRADVLRELPQAGFRFLSCEPLLGPLTGLDVRGIDWIIAGAESGQGARPMEKDWVRHLRDLCERAHIPFFYKQDADATGHKIPLPPLDGRIWDEQLLRCSCCSTHVAPWRGQLVDGPFTLGQLTPRHWVCENCL